MPPIIRLPWRLAPALLPLVLSAQSALAPDVHEARLRNGIRVLAVERPGSGVVRVGLFFRGGGADTGALPASAARLIVETVFSELRAEDVEPRPDLDPLLERADHLREALRIEALRRARSLGSPAGAEDEQSLRAALAQTLDRIARASSAPDQPDLLDELGAVHRTLAAEPDLLSMAMDLPARSLPSWADLEARRLRILRMARLPRLRARLEAAFPAAGLADRLLVESAFPGLPYGRALEPGGLAGVLREDLVASARSILAPGRLAVALVGDLRSAELLPVLESTFGTLEPADQPERADPCEELCPLPGGRRVQVRVSGPQRLRLGWPIPPLAHPDRLALDLLASFLSRRSGGQGTALPTFLKGKARTGMPGGRMENLFVVDAVPEEGHGLTECEQEIERTVLRLQEDALSAEAFEGALRRFELDALEVQADASLLVERLGTGWCQGGDWRVAFPDLRALRREGPAAVSRAARAYLRNDRAIVVLLEPDLARDPGDAGQAELLRLLRALALAKLGDPVKAEALALRSMEQLRMLSRQQREQVLQAMRQGTR